LYCCTSTDAPRQSGGSSAQHAHSHGSNAVGEKINRNDRVTITKDGQEQEIKFKKLEQFQKEGWTLKSNDVKRT
jgi:hypothetical protein